jgi:hypothetical protein
VTRAPSEVVAAEPEALRAAARRLDRGAGTAWAGDARQGFSGGAFCLRWVRDEQDAAEAAAFLAARCGQVRVMPFLKGIPSSIHGIVFPLRWPRSGRSRWSPCAARGRPACTTSGRPPSGTPPDEDRAVMRDLVRRVGAGLRHRVGYRGAFTVDGVLAAEGVLPTEPNPRRRRLDGDREGARRAQAQPSGERAADATRELPVVFEGGACRPARAVR